MTNRGVRPGLVLLLSCLAATARAADGAPDDAARDRLSFTLTSGLSFPNCSDGTCGTTLGLAPTARALVLYEPRPAWALGLVGQLARVSRGLGSPHGASACKPG